MNGRFDDAVVGAGIIGLAHAYTLAKRGRRVVVFERDDRAAGASVRNFGMLWPIGQPVGSLRGLALRSRAIWIGLLDAAGLWHDRVGSLHLAYRDDEAQVLREFADEPESEALGLRLLDPSAVRQRAPAVRRDGLQLGLFSPTETCVDPREVVAGLPNYLAEHLGVRFEFGRAVLGYDRPRVRTSAGDCEADRLWVCTGDDFRTLYAETHRSLGLVRCKLQMMRTGPLERGKRLGPMLAGGLTLRHYRAFEGCPTLPTLRARVAAEMPEFDRFGIHVMTSQNGRGEVVIGDSHEYDGAIEPFDKQQIDALILDYLDTFLDLPGLSIAARWHGTYAKHPDRPYVVERPADGVTVVVGVGGAGMTLSFGLAEQVVDESLAE